MKKFILGLVVFSLIFGNIHAFAIGETARATAQKFYYNGTSVTIKAYSITDASGDTNFVAMRDVCIIFDRDLEYVPQPESAYITTTRPYSGDKSTNVTDPYPTTAITAFSPVTIYVNGKWELMAAHQINDRTYVKLRDIVKHLGGTTEYDEKADTVYLQSGDTKPTPTPTPFPTSKFKDVEQADAAVASFIEEVNNSGLDVEGKIRNYLADYVADHLYYDNDMANAVINNTPFDPSKSTLNYIFTHTDGRGVCGAYANTFEYLCEKTNIPCVSVMDKEHAWNEVYVNGKWLICDLTAYDVGRGSGCLLITYNEYPRTDGNPALTAERKVQELQRVK